MDHGIVIKRIDLPGAPEVKPHISLIGDLVRNTGLTTEALSLFVRFWLSRPAIRLTLPSE